MKNLIFILILLIAPFNLSAQEPTLKSKLIFDADFRFRIEQDWHSKKSNGTYRDDRTRLRYRLRAGLTYEEDWYSTGFRIRTGTPNKQQDPQLTLGTGFKEFAILPIGLEKAYFKGKWETFNFWVGKNTFPFKKNNELFWSDNVYPEGIFLEKGFKLKSKYFNSINLKAGHFIMSSVGKTLNKDTYFQGYQAHFKFLKNRFELFPSFYLFKNVPNIPDGNEAFTLDYSILHIGTKIKLLKSKLLNIELDYMNNMIDYSQHDSIINNFKNQKSGMIIGLKYGALNEKGDWLVKASYANIQKYSAVDFMAQNDWARWDYSSNGSPDGRLTNFNGIEIVVGYKISEKINLKMKYYTVEQLIRTGSEKETGNRIRLDLDVKF